MKKAPLFFLSCALLVSGCSSWQEPERPEAKVDEPELGEVTIPSETGDYSLPLDPYVGSYSDREVILDLHEIALQECFLRLGYEWTLYRQDPTPFTRGEVVSQEWFSKADVEEYGYEWPIELIRWLDQAQRGPYQATRDEGGFTDDEFGALIGDQSHQPPAAGEEIPEGGCIGEANRAIGSEAADSPFEFVDDLAREAEERTYGDSRLFDVTVEWSRCMHESGYDYAHLFDPENDPRWGGESNSAAERGTPKEIAAAVADVECRVEVNHAGVALAVSRAYEQRVLDENFTALEEYRLDFEEMVADAIDRIAEGSH